MKRAEAYLRPAKTEEVKLALEEIGAFGMSCEHGRGDGRQWGPHDLDSGPTCALHLVSPMRWDVGATDARLGDAREANLRADQTGECGDAVPR